MEPVKDAVVKSAAPVTQKEHVHAELKGSAVCGEPPAMQPGESWAKMEYPRQRAFLKALDRWRECAERTHVKCDLSPNQVMKLDKAQRQLWVESCRSDDWHLVKPEKEAAVAPHKSAESETSPTQTKKRTEAADEKAKEPKRPSFESAEDEEWGGSNPLK